MTMRLALIASLVLALAACGNQSGERVTTTTSGATSTTVQGATTTTLESPPAAPELDLTAIPEWFQDEDAAPQALVSVIGGRLDAEYVGSMAIEWPTAGLGCGSGGEELQVITPGYVIFFTGGDGLIRVHASETGQWKQCDLGRPLDGTPTVRS